MAVSRPGPALTLVFPKSPCLAHDVKGSVSFKETVTNKGYPNSGRYNIHLSLETRSNTFYSTTTVFGSQPSGGGYFGAISSSASRTMREMAALRAQLRSAGMTYQGAWAVEQRVSAVS